MTRTRTLADDLATLARLNAAIEHKRADVGHLKELVEFHWMFFLPSKKRNPAADAAPDIARWHSARRRLRWMEAKRDRFGANVNAALRATPSPFDPAP